MSRFDDELQTILDLEITVTAKLRAIPPQSPSGPTPEQEAIISTIIDGLRVIDGLADGLTPGGPPPPPPPPGKPVITINGENPATVVVGVTYADDGASSSDGQMVAVGGLPIDTSGPGSHNVTYDVPGADQAIRVVNVVVA